MERMDPLSSRILNTANHLPQDNEINERKRQIDSNRPEGEEDSDSDDSIDGSFAEAYWDVLFPNDKPFENTLDDLKKMQESMPTRVLTRSSPKMDFRDLEKPKKESKSLDIDSEIAMENLERIRLIINEKIEKKNADLERRATELKEERKTMLDKLDRMKI